jgi:hypothetical protein
MIVQEMTVGKVVEADSLMNNRPDSAICRRG